MTSLGHLGIIDTDLCLWAGTLTAADMEAALVTTGHPVIKAKPGPVEAVVALPPVGPTGIAGLDAIICTINAWVNANPVLAGASIAAGYLLLRRGRSGRSGRRT